MKRQREPSTSPRRLDAASATLEKDGFRVFSHAFEFPASKELSTWRSLVRKHGSAVFNGGDSRRTQCDLYPTGALRDLAARIAPHLECENWVVMASAPGARAQPAHCDFNPSTFPVDAPLVPCGMLVALDPITFFDVWPGSWQRIRSRTFVLGQRRRVCLQAGDALVFRGDLVHGGASWHGDKANVRLHAYLDAPDVPRRHNYTYRVT